MRKQLRRQIHRRFASMPFSFPVHAQKNARFDPDGSFWIIGDHGDGFSDFGGINLNAKRLRRLPPAGDTTRQRQDISLQNANRQAR